MFIVEVITLSAFAAFIIGYPVKCFIEAPSWRNFFFILAGAAMVGGSIYGYAS